MSDKTRQNDWIAVELNSYAGVLDETDRFANIFASGINSENTIIHEPEYYYNISQIQKTFQKENGEFDEVKFNQFYVGALREYNDFSNEDFLEKYIQTMERSPYDWSNMQAPVMDTSVYLAPVSDKNRRTQGLGNIWQAGAPVFSDREVAQEQKVRDLEGNKLDWTPNEKGGLKAFWRPTIVMATYDEDQYDENGRLIHQKGDLKLDWKGDPYPELLGDREVYGKEVFTISDTLTKEGSFWNKIDPFDSDSIEKSVGQTIAETTLKIAPWVIASLTGTTPFLAAIAITKELATTVPSALKAINGVTGEKDSIYGKSLNKWESWMRRFDKSTSDKGRQAGFFYHENIGDIIVSSFSQLAAQRTIGSLGKYLSSNRTRQTKIGQELAKHYMSLTSTTHAYQAFKDAGASDEIAGAGMFLTYAAMYGLQSIGYFNKWIWKNTFLDENREIGKAVEKYVFEEASKFIPAVKAAEKTAKTEAEKAAVKAFSKQWFKNFYNSTKGFIKSIGNPDNVSDDAGIKGLLSSVAQRSLNEGVEETMEEVSGDMVKGLALGLEALDIKVSDDGKKLDFGFTPESFLARYGAAFLGGAIGGSVFELYGRLDGYQSPLSGLKTNTEKIIWAHRNGYDEYIFDKIENMKKRGEIPGNPNLAAYDFDVSKDTDNANFENRVFKQAKDKDNQPQAIYDFVKRDLKLLFDVLDSNLTKTTDYQLALTQIYADKLAENDGEETPNLALSAAHQLLLNSGLLDIVAADLDFVGRQIFDTQMGLYRANKRFDAAKEVSEKNSAKQDVDFFNEQLKTLKEEYEEIRTGKRADKYMHYAYSALNQWVLNGYLNVLPTDEEMTDLSKKLFHEGDIRRYLKLEHDIDNYDELSEEQKAYYTKLFNERYNDKGSENDRRRARAQLLFRLHYILSERFGKDIQKVGEKYKGYKRDVVLDKIISTYLELVNLQNTAITVKTLKMKAALEGDAESLTKLTEAEANIEKEVKQILQREQDKVDKLIEKQNAGIKLSQSELDTISDFEEFKNLYDLLTVFNFDDDLERTNYRQRIIDFYTKFKSDSRMSNNTNLLLEHYTSVLFSDIARARQLNIGENQEIPDITQNIVTPEIMQKWMQSIGVAAGRISGQFNGGHNHKDFLEEIKMNPLIAKEIRARAIERISEKVLHATEGLTGDAKQEAIRQRWADLGMTPEEYFVKTMMPSDLEAVNAIIELSEMVKPLIDVNNNELLKELLQNLSIEVNGKPLDILARYEAEFARYQELMNSPEDFEIDPQSLEELHTALNLIRIMASLVDSAGNGHNAFTNKYKKALEKELFAELDLNQRSLLMNQLQYLYNQINGLITKAEGNAISLSEEQKEITYNMAPKLIKALWDFDDNDDEKEEKKTIGRAIQATLTKNNILTTDGKEVFNIKKWWENWQASSGVVIDNITNDESFDKFINARRQFYKELRDAIIKAKGASAWQTIGKDLSEAMGDLISDMRSTRFAKKSEVETVESRVSAIDASMYFMSIIGSNINDFELMSKKYFDETNQFLPYFAQEYAAQLTWSYIQNTELFNGFLDGVSRQLHEQSDDKAKSKESLYIENMYKIHNFMMIDGIAGSGKSTGVARLLTAVLKQQNSDLKIVALSTIEQRHIDIAKTVGAEIHGSIDTLFDEIFIDENGRKVKYDKEKYGPKPKFSMNQDDPQMDHYDPSENLKRNQMRNDAALASDSQNVLYLIDEVTRLTEDQLIVLAEYVKKLRENGINAFIVGLGDSTQSHAYDEDAETTTNISTCTYLSTPQLSVSLRKANRGIRDNNQKLEKWVKKGVDYYKRFPGIPLNVIDQYIESNRPLKENQDGSFNFIYEEDVEYFYGHRFVEDSSGWVDNFLSKRPFIGSQSRVLIIVDDDTESKYNSYKTDEYKDRVVVRKLVDVQGDQFDYVIVDRSFTNRSKEYFESLRDFYTAISRAKIGSVIVNVPLKPTTANDTSKTGGASEVFGIKSMPTKDATFTVVDPESEKAKASNAAYREWRLARYGNLQTTSTEGSTSSDGGETGTSGESGESVGTTGSTTGGTTPPSPKPNQSGIDEDEYLDEVRDLSEEELKQEFAESNTTLGKAYAEALAAQNSEFGTTTVLKDEDYLKHIRETDLSELIITDIEGENLSREDTINLLTYVSSYVLSRISAVKEFGEDQSEVTYSGGLADTIGNLSGKFRNVIGENIANVNGGFYITPRGDKSIIYWVISNKDGKLALPIAISDKAPWSGYFTKLSMTKINTMIPISSKGRAWRNVVGLLKEKGIVKPEQFGIYVGTDERLKQDGDLGYNYYTKGKALLPIAEAWRLPGWGATGFFEPVGSGTDLVWLTKGYNLHPAWRTHEIAMQRRISYSSYLEKARLLYDIYHTNDSRREEAIAKLSSYFGTDMSDVQYRTSDSTDKEYSNESNAKFFDAVKRYRLLSSTTRDNLIAEMFDFAINIANEVEADAFFSNVSKMLIGQKHSALKISYKTEDVPNSQPLSFYLVDEGHVGENRNYKVYVEVIQGKKWTYKSIDVTIPVAATTNMGRIDISAISETLISGLEKSNITVEKTTIDPKIKNLITNKPKPLVSFGSVDYNSADVRIFPVTDHILVTKLLSGDGPINLFNLSFEEYLKTNDSELKHGLYAWEHQDWDETDINFKSVLLRSDDEKRHCDIIDVLMPAYSLSSQFAEHTSIEPDEETQLFLNQIGSQTEVDAESEEPSIGSAGENVTISTQNNVTIFKNCYVNKTFVDKYTNNIAESGSAIVLNKIDWNTGEIWVGGAKYRINNPIELRTFIETSLNQSIVNVTSKFEWSVSGGKIVYDKDKNLFTFNDTAIKRVVITYDSKKLIVFVGSDVYELDYTDSIPKPDIKIVAKKDSAYLIETNNGYKELFMGTIGDAGNINDYNFIYGYNPVIQVKPEIQTRSTSKITQKQNSEYILSDIKANGAQLNQWIGKTIFEDDQVEVIQKIDLKNKKITIGLFNPVTYDLSSSITKFETFGFGIEPEILIDVEAEWKSFIKKANMKLVSYWDNLEELLIDKDIDGSMQRMQEFFDRSIFKLGKHVKLSINNSGEIIITEEPGDNHIYQRVSEICAKIKTINPDKITDVAWEKDSKYPKILVSLSDETVRTFEVKRNRSKKEYEYTEIIKEVKYMGDDVKTQIENSSLDDESKKILLDALTSSDLSKLYTETTVYSQEYEQLATLVAMFVTEQENNQDNDENCLIKRN